MQAVMQAAHAAPRDDGSHHRGCGILGPRKLHLKYGVREDLPDGHPVSRRRACYDAYLRVRTREAPADLRR